MFLRIIDRVLVVLMGNPSEAVIVLPEVILLEIVSTGIAEHLGRHWRSVHVILGAHDLNMLFHRVGTIVELTTQRATLHLLKSQSQSALHLTGFDRILCQLEGRGTSRTIIVDINDRYTGQTQFIHSSLSTRAITCCINMVSLTPGVPGSLIKAYHKHSQQRLARLYRR